MEATGQVYREAVVYMRIRLWGAPAVVVILAALLFQPINAFAFATDGIHWGTEDFRYLRNATLGASTAGALGILPLDTTHPQALVGLWIITGGWVTLRALFSIVRIWPGIGSSPMTVEVHPREDR